MSLTPTSLLLSAVRIVGLAYVGMCLMVVFRQSRFVYHPDREESMTPGDVGLPYEEVRLTTADGETLAAWFVPAGNDHAPVLLFCHGNAGDRADRVGTVALMHDMGFAVLLFDYRGYGSSTGRPSENGTYADARAAWDYLVETRGIPAARIVVYGRSLGGAVGAPLAAEVQPAALVVESCFSSAPDMAARMFPYLPVRLLCRFRYDTKSAVAAVACPVMVAHSPGDKMIAFSHGRRIFDTAPEPRVFVETTGGHNDGGLDVDPAYRRKLKEFVMRYASGGGHDE
jgi:fermentation-respiration switch protein FrsA (DUF1100 family)